jgi:hypothetical protein
MATSQERDGDPITVYPLWGKRHNSDDSPDSPWTRKVILSLGNLDAYDHRKQCVLHDIH